MNGLGMKVIPTLVLCLSVRGAWAQSAPQAGCTLDPPIFTSSAPNIFNDRQEQDLGDALAESLEPELRIAAPAEDDQLTRIGERLLATLPQTGIHYRFRIFDSGEINGFSITGGRVYISRKLIAAVKSEDELAGVLAHEIGHLFMHQTAIEVTRIFRIRLHVTQVTDRADIFAKVHQLMSTQAKSNEEENTEEKDELAADRVGLWAMTRAGYAPESYSAFFNQISMNRGKTGSWLTDAFRLTQENSKRYRSALKLIDALPGGCKGRSPEANNNFQAWLKKMVEERVKTESASVGGDQPVKLDPPLRPGLWRIRFSPNGKYILAQDEGGVAVVNLATHKVLFRIDAPEADAAQFTPDSENIVFSDENLRVERWSMATGKRSEVKELVVLDGCTQRLLTPDGKTLVCLRLNMQSDNPRVELRLFDVASGSAFFDKPSFYKYESYLAAYWELQYTGDDLASLRISQDGKYLLVVLHDRSLAFNLEQRQSVELGGILKSLSQTRMAFLGPDKLYLTGKLKSNPAQGYEAWVLSFPDGHVLNETAIGRQQIHSVTKGSVLIASIPKEEGVKILDPVQMKYLAQWKQPLIDVWEQTYAAEDATGGLDFMEIGKQDILKIPLPPGVLPSLRAAAFSSDGKYLAFSLNNRAAIWDLETGKQLLLTRPFRSAWVDTADHLFSQLIKYRENDPAEIDLTLATAAVKDLGKYENKDWQYHDLQMEFKPKGKDESADRNATLEVKKMGSQTVTWSKVFRYEKPACWPAEDNRLVLAWDLTSDSAKDEIKKYPQLKQEVEAQKNHNKGLLIETVNPETGAPLEQVALPEVDLTRGWDDERFARVSGEFVLVRGEHGNSVIYRLDTGTKVGEFFGLFVASDAAAGLVAAVNREDEVLLVDERTGKELSRFTLGSPVRAARIVTTKVKTLLVLTADQVVHQLPLPK